MTHDLQAPLDKFRPFTMVPDESLAELAEQVRLVLELGIPGDFVECGSWRGGAAFLMAALAREAGADRITWLFDSFEGIPPPEPVDGAAAHEWAADTESPDYFDNLRVSVDEVQASATELGLASHVRLVKGLFEETLPRFRAGATDIAILRIDADWHASVRCCLDNLYELVVEGGIVIFDDYYTYEGCALAVHEFLGERAVPYPLESGPRAAALEGSRHGAVLRKHRETWSEAWSWLSRSRAAAVELGRLIPPESQLIVIDDGRAPVELPAGHRRPLPLPEEAGAWAGRPEDDAAAVRELERLRQAGASFVAVLWPAFWWLDHYAGLREHLRSRYRELAANELMILFDLTE